MTILYDWLGLTEIDIRICLGFSYQDLEFYKNRFVFSDLTVRGIDGVLIITEKLPDQSEIVSNISVTPEPIYMYLPEG